MSRILSFDDLCRIIGEMRSSRTLLTFHSMGDSDGVGSAVALSSLFEDSVVVTPDFVTHDAKLMLAQSGHAAKIENAFPKGCTFALVTDANNIAALGGMGERMRAFEGTVVFLDHHAAVKDNLPENFAIFDSEEFNSASGIAYEVMKKLGARITGETALLLLDGIIADSAGFQNATAATFMQVSELLGISGWSYSRILDYFHRKVPAARRYALIRELFSAKLEMAGECILICGSASGNASLAAESAILFGADASVFWASDESEARISARLRSPLDERFSIHLGRLMQEAGMALGGSGGGHPCAAGAYGPRGTEVEEAAGRICSFIKERLSAGRTQDQ